MDNFQLQWDQFESNLATSFKEIREDGELFDITLVCDDDQIEAHKMILSASSDFLSHPFLKNGCDKEFECHHFISFHHF